MLIVMSGLPGAGKSAVADGLARALPAPVLSVDPIEAALWQAGIDRAQPTGYAAYAVADTQSRRLLALGLTVIVDAVNNVEPAQQGWIAVARELAVPLRVIVVICSDAVTHRDRLARRDRDLGAFREPTWDEVQARAVESRPWPVEHLTLDSVDDHDANVTRALDYVAGR